MTDALPQYSIAQARDQLTQLVHTAEQGTPIEITRRGKRVAVLLSAEEFDRLLSNKGTFGESLSQFRDQWDIEALDLNPDELFGNVRDRSAGREVSL